MATFNRTNRSNEENTLYVSDLPDELNKDGIHKLFKDYGRITAIVAPSDAKYAFISYGTFAEAEAAIRALNNKAPLYLQVSFGTPFVQPVLLQTPSPIPALSQPSNGFFQYTPLELQYAERNDLWSRGYSWTIDTAGRRHVTMSRGYTRYHIPNPHPSVKEQASKVSEVSRCGSYRFHQDRQHEKIGRCLACDKYCIQTCASSNKHYCNRECQATDWPRHRITDCTLPVLNNNNEQTRLTKSRTIQIRKQMRKPKFTLHPHTKPDGIQHIVKSIETLTVAKLSTPKIDNNVKVVNVEVPKKLEKISEVKTPSPPPPSSSSASAAKQNKANIIDEPDFRFLVSQMIDLIPKTEFIECVISHVASPGYLFAVQRFCDVEAINNLIFELNENASTLKQIKNPACGLRYGVKFENIWLRAQVVRDEPLTVEYIDYGTFETITDGQFIDLGEYAFIPRFSVLVRLPRESIEEYKLLEVESIIDLKMVASDPEDDIINVIVKPDGIQQVVKSIETQTFPTEFEMIRLGEIGEEVECCLHMIIESGSRYVFVPNDPVLAYQTRKMHQDINRCYKPTEEFIPRQNEFCLIHYEDNKWYRGGCLDPKAEDDAALIFFLDYGSKEIIKHNRILKIENKFLETPAIGVISSVDFTINGKISPGIIEKLEQFLVIDELYKIKILNIDEASSEYIIDIPDARNILVEAGLFN